MKGIWRNLHRYVLWAIVSFVFWAWVISRITDAPAGRKLLLYADVPAMDRTPLSAQLEAGLPDTIEFAEARAFTDEMFSPGQVNAGDLFVVPEAEAERFLASFTAIDPAAFPGQTYYESEGKVYGVCVWDEGAGIACGRKYVLYEPGERYYLFFGAQSLHLGALNGSADDAAIVAARTFLSLP